MYKELFIFAIGVIVGMIIMHYVLKPELGHKYEIKRFKQSAKKNEGSAIDNQINAHMEAKQPKKDGILKRLKYKRKLKRKEKWN